MPTRTARCLAVLLATTLALWAITVMLLHGHPPVTQDAHTHQVTSVIAVTEHVDDGPHVDLHHAEHTTASDTWSVAPDSAARTNTRQLGPMLMVLALLVVAGMRRVPVTASSGRRARSRPPDDTPVGRREVIRV